MFITVAGGCGKPQSEVSLSSTESSAEQPNEKATEQYFTAGWFLREMLKADPKVPTAAVVRSTRNSVIDPIPLNISYMAKEGDAFLDEEQITFNVHWEEKVHCDDKEEGKTKQAYKITGVKRS